GRRATRLLSSALKIEIELSSGLTMMTRKPSSVSAMVLERDGRLSATVGPPLPPPLPPPPLPPLPPAPPSASLLLPGGAPHPIRLMANTHNWAIGGRRRRLPSDAWFAIVILRLPRG